jgi:uncharacterized protein (DUF1330 family)
MLYITQLIFLHPGQEALFNAFEDVAIPLIEKYNGRMLYRLKTEAVSSSPNADEQPDEVHIISFGSEEDLRAFMKDETRNEVLHLKEASVKTSVLIRGVRI